jgi:hypothetical protein
MAFGFTGIGAQSGFLDAMNCARFIIIWKISAYPNGTDDFATGISDQDSFWLTSEPSWPR